jgi:hypothetical protein
MAFMDIGAQGPERLRKDACGGWNSTPTGKRLTTKIGKAFFISSNGNPSHFCRAINYEAQTSGGGERASSL